MTHACQYSPDGTSTCGEPARAFVRVHPGYGDTNWESVWLCDAHLADSSLHAWWDSHGVRYEY